MNESLNRRFILNLIFSIFILWIIYSFIKLISPFVMAIFLGIVFSVIYYPFYLTLIRRKINESLSSIITILFMLFTIIIPFMLFFWLLFKEVKYFYPQTLDYLSNSKLNLNIDFSSFIPISKIDLKEIFISNFEEFQKAIIKSAGTILKNIFFFFINFFVMLFSMFFFLKDGVRLINWIVDMIPLENKHIESILKQFSITTNAIMRGVIITAFIQGVTASIGYYIAGFYSPVIFGFLVMLGAFVPFIGTSSVTIPVAIYSYLVYGKTIGIFLLLWGILIVGLVDNLIRPILIGKGAKLPIAMVFLGIAGGLKTYGPIGIFIGPIFVSLIIALLEIYREKIRI